MLRPFLIISFCLFSMLGYAQSDLESTPYIEVTGSSTKKIVPDQIFISIKITENPEIKDGKSIEKQEEEMKLALREEGINLKNLRVTGSNSHIRSGGWFQDDKVVAFKDYELMVKDAEQLQKVFNVLQRLKIIQAKVSRVHHSKMQEFQKENRLDAIKAAREKAAYLLEALDEEVGRPLIIRDADIPINPYIGRLSGVSAYSNTISYEAPDIAGSNNLDFKTIEIRNDIVVRFAIANP